MQFPLGRHRGSRGSGLAPIVVAVILLALVVVTFLLLPPAAAGAQVTADAMATVVALSDVMRTTPAACLGLCQI